MRITATITPPLMRSVSASATRSLLLWCPCWDENKKVTGLIDVLNKRAYEMQDGKRVEIEVPEDKVAVINEFNDALKESVAETSEEFMERFFNGEDFTYAEMAQGLRQGVRELSMFPVLCGSAVAGMGTLMLLDNIVELLPSPEQGNYHKATLADGTTEEFVVSAGGVPTAFVFKTISDQYGKYSFVKVLSGSHHAGYDHGQRPHRRQREAGPPVYHAGQEGHRGQGAGVRRYRRHRQDG